MQIKEYDDSFAATTLFTEVTVDIPVLLSSQTFPKVNQGFILGAGIGAYTMYMSACRLYLMKFLMQLNWFSFFINHKKITLWIENYVIWLWSWIHYCLVCSVSCN